MSSLTSTSNHGCLPEDLILEILLRLPVKSLLRFKCVCKRWCAVIESPSFVCQHFDHENNQEHLLIRNYIPDKDRYSFALYLDDALCCYEEPDYLQMPVKVAALVGPLNGIFCMVGASGRIALFNPATRHFKPLPVIHFKAQPHLSPYDDLLGFGLDPLSGNYKVVSIQYFWNEELDSPHYPSLVSVYNSGTDSWRHFENSDLVNSSRCAYKSLCNTYLNGVYYWLTECNDTDVAVLAFHMSNETFREIKVPDSIKSKEGDLAFYGDSLALLSCDLDEINKCIDVWVMKKEGSWTKCFTVGPFQDINWPLGFTKNGELLLESESSFLTLYDVNTKKLRTVEARRRENGFFIYWIFYYKESLISVGGEGAKCEQWDPSLDFARDFL